MTLTMSTVTSPILNVPCFFLNSATLFCSCGIMLAMTSFKFCGFEKILANQIKNNLIKRENEIFYR